MIDRRSAVSVVIPNGESLSSAGNISGHRISGIIMPADWTAANLTFQGSHDNATFQNLYDDGGTEINVTAADDRNISVSAEISLAISAFRWLKVRSGTAGTAVNQGAARTITLVLF